MLTEEFSPERVSTMYVQYFPSAFSLQIQTEMNNNRLYVCNSWVLDYSVNLFASLILFVVNTHPPYYYFLSTQGTKIHCFLLTQTCTGSIHRLGESK